MHENDLIEFFDKFDKSPTIRELHNPKKIKRDFVRQLQNRHEKKDLMMEGMVKQ